MAQARSPRRLNLASRSCHTGAFESALNRTQHDLPAPTGHERVGAPPKQAPNQLRLKHFQYQPDGAKLKADVKTAFDAINVLRWHYGMIGQPKSAERPVIEPLEAAFGLALGTTDPAAFECLCPVLIFNEWSAEALVARTPEHLKGRLRLAAGIGLFFTDFSRLGMLRPLETTAALKAVKESTTHYLLDKDPWTDPTGANEPDGLYLEFFRPYGLYVNWPLADFWKQYQWAAVRNQARINEFVERAAVARAE